MKLWSTAWQNGEPIPARHAAAHVEGSQVVAGANLSPPLAWGDLPAGCRSLVLICHDFDMPLRRGGDSGNAPSAECDRADFFHWVLVDLPPTLSGLAEGDGGQGFTPGGRADATAPHGARHGDNDFTRWYDGDAAHAGRYAGYDGPHPPADDPLVHHYLFTLYALSVDRLPVDAPLTGATVREALAGRVLDAATLSGTYTLNRLHRGV
jgi:Raf kinase inhibitor-like YbhB/YbcL family protein